MRVKADFDLCESNAICVGLAPETFALDDDDYLQVLDEHVSPAHEQRVRQAVAACPKAALSLVDE